MAAFTDAIAAVFDRAGAATASLGIGSGYYQRLADVETGGTFNPNAQNPNSSAGGLFQFLSGTWNSYGTGSKFGTGSNVSSAIAQLTKDNYGYLVGALGRKPSEGELYLAHQQGAGTAAKLLQNPNADAASIVGFDALTLNGGSLGMTAGEFANMWTSKFPSGAVDGVENKHYDFDESQVPLSQRSDASLGDYISSYFIRGAVLILGFIFVAVGLAMFKQTAPIVQPIRDAIKK